MGDNVTIRVGPKIALAPITIPRDVQEEMAKVIEAGVLDNIRTQKQAGGAPLKANAPLTIERKRAAGRPQLSLVDEQHRFTKGKGRSWGILRFLPKDRGFVFGPVTDELRKLVGYVQGKGYTGWLAVSTGAAAGLRKVVQNHVTKVLRSSGRKSQ